MASMTDLVSEGLKYPFNDMKKLLTFGVLFTLLSVISFGIGVKSVDFIRAVENTPGRFTSIVHSGFPSNDIYIILLLTLISFIITLLIMGYQYNVIKFSIAKNNDLPEFGVLNLLKNGIKYFIVSFIYNIIPTIVLIAGMELLSINNGDYLVSIIAFILFIICNFLLIMALTNMVDADKFIKAFDLREIVDKIAGLGWIKYIGLILFTFFIYMIIMIATSMIMMFISIFLAMAFEQMLFIFAVITLIEGLFISPYISIFFHRVYGSVYREAIG